MTPAQKLVTAARLRDGAKYCDDPNARRRDEERAAALEREAKAERATAAVRNLRGGLSLTQKRVLSQLAHRAWVENGKPGRADDFRRKAVMDRVGKDGLTACKNADYAPLKTHFIMMCGDTCEAFDAAMREGDDLRRRLTHALSEAMALGDFSMRYVQAIAADKFEGKTDLSKLSDAELHDLVKTTANRARTKTKNKQ